MFIFAKPCLFLSRFDCYSAGWDGSFSQSACFQGANNERLSIRRHGKKSQPLLSQKTISCCQTPRFGWIFDTWLEDPQPQPPGTPAPVRSGEALSRRIVRTGCSATRHRGSDSPVADLGEPSRALQSNSHTQRAAAADRAVVICCHFLQVSMHPASPRQSPGSHG